MRRLFLLLTFVLVYIEISIFIKIAAALGVAITLLLVVFTSCIGISLVRRQGLKAFMQMQQKLVAGESLAEEMTKRISLMLAGLLLIIPGFLTDIFGLLLLLPPVRNLFFLRLMRFLPVAHFGRENTKEGSTTSNIFEGEFQRREDSGYLLNGKPVDEEKSNDRIIN